VVGGTVVVVVVVVDEVVVVGGTVVVVVVGAINDSTGSTYASSAGINAETVLRSNCPSADEIT
jgi:hypothetical protein